MRLIHWPKKWLYGFPLFSFYQRWFWMLIHLISFTQCHITKLVAFNRYIHHHQSNSGNSLNKQTEKCNNVSPRKVVNQSQKSERKGTRQITCIWLLTVTKHHHHRYNLVSQARWFGRTQLKQPKTSKMALFNIHPFGKHQFSKMIESDNFWKISFPL